ncbi:hypothetical protein SSTU70S_05543 [Stutzerimonas stutzeri]
MRYVTAKSAVEALHHLEQDNGPGRLDQARAMLEGVEQFAVIDTLALGKLLELDTILWNLANTVRDVERQESNEYRARYLGECRAIVSTLRIAGLISQAEADQWRADILKANLASAEKCAAAGNPGDEMQLSRERFRLEDFIKEGVIPRDELPR